MPWQVFQETGFNYAVPVFALLAFIVVWMAPSERRAVLRSTAVLALAILVAFASVLFARGGWESGAKWAAGTAVLLVGISVIQLAGVFAFRVFLWRLGLEPPRILQDVVVAVAVLVWGLLTLHRWGADLTGIITTSAVLTAVIGFSLQDTLGNILGGLALQLDQSVKVNDWIQVDEHVVGRVVEIRWRQTSLETRDWETVVVPNSVLVKNRFLVLGRRLGQPVQQRQWIPFLVNASYSPVRVIETVETALAATTIHGVSKEPAPACMLMDLGGGVPRYAVAYWLNDLGAKNPTDSAVRVHICSALKRAGIPLAIPAQNVRFTEEAAEREREDRRETERRLTALGSSDLFSHLSADELGTLAGRLEPAPFSRGDVLVKQGDEAYSLYLLTEGKADVYVENESGERARVTELCAGSLVGEMGLMTGEPRAATVIARTDVECYRLEKEAFRDLVASRPEVADAISVLLARRRIELEATISHLDEEARAAWAARAGGDIRRRILHFFGIDD